MNKHIYVLKKNLVCLILCCVNQRRKVCKGVWAAAKEASFGAKHQPGGSGQHSRYTGEPGWAD